MLTCKITLPDSVHPVIISKNPGFRALYLAQQNEFRFFRLINTKNVFFHFWLLASAGKIMVLPESTPPPVPWARMPIVAIHLLICHYADDTRSGNLYKTLGASFLREMWIQVYAIFCTGNFYFAWNIARENYLLRLIRCKKVAQQQKLVQESMPHVLVSCPSRRVQVIVRVSRVCVCVMGIRLLIRTTH